MQQPDIAGNRIVADDHQTDRRRWLIGPETGAEHLLLSRSEWPAGFVVGLHRHDGEEGFFVLSGEVRFTVDGERIVCAAGDSATVPAGAEHGFRVLADAAILVFREQELQSIAVFIEPDGVRREIEIFQYGPPWSKIPPAGEDLTPVDEVRRIYETTSNLL
jgi:quercetin dioxygenase-like cupin family protein